MIPLMREQALRSLSGLAGERRIKLPTKATMTDTQFIGKSVQRKEGREKVTGSAQYVDDLTFPDMLHGATVRSAIARGTNSRDPFRRRHSLERIHDRSGSGHSRKKLHRPANR